MPGSWKDFSEAYKNASPTESFYKKAGGDVVREKAKESSAPGKTVQDRLGLLTPDKVQAAKWEWTAGSNKELLSAVLSNLAKSLGSKNPNFDAVLMLEQLYKLSEVYAFPFNADDPKDISLKLENGKICISQNGMEMVKGPLVVLQEVEVAHEVATTQVKQESHEEQVELKEEVSDTNLGKLLGSIFDDMNDGKFPRLLTPFNNLLTKATTGSEDFYRSLMEIFSKNPRGYKGFPEYVEHFTQSVNELEADSTSLDKEKLTLLSDAINEIQRSYLKDRTKYYRHDIDALVARLHPSMEVQAQDFYKRLGLDASQIHNPASNLLEFALRREQVRREWTDDMQDKLAEINAIGDDNSIGAFQVNPSAYWRGLLMEHGITPAVEGPSEGEQNRRLATTINGLTTNEDTIAVLLDPQKSLAAYESVLKTYIPAKNEPIAIILDRKDGKGPQPYQIPLAESYHFKDRNNHSLDYTHEELRLAQAVGRYQGLGIRLFSKDVAAPIKDKLITKTDDLILSNDISVLLGVA